VESKKYFLLYKNTATSKTQGLQIVATCFAEAYCEANRMKSFMAGNPFSWELKKIEEAAHVVTG